eukprot:5526675-Lingulodinium_polyedra.AAC.1
MGQGTRVPLGSGDSSVQCMQVEKGKSASRSSSLSPLSHLHPHLVRNAATVTINIIPRASAIFLDLESESFAPL